MSYVKPAAKLLVVMLTEHIERGEPTRTLQRDILLERWKERFPNQARRQQLVTEKRKVIRRRTSHLAGAEHHRGGRSQGRTGTAKLNEALRQLDHLGVLRREESTVVILDVPQLVALARPVHTNDQPDHEPHRRPDDEPRAGDDLA